MSDKFMVAAVISIIFLISKFIEMRFIEKENKPLKLLIRDTILVYFSVISGYIIIGQISPMLQGVTSSNVTPVFTDNPGF